MQSIFEVLYANILIIYVKKNTGQLINMHLKCDIICVQVINASSGIVNNFLASVFITDQSKVMRSTK